MGAFDNFDPTGDKKKPAAVPPFSPTQPAPAPSGGAFSNFNPSGAGTPAASTASNSDDTPASFNQPESLGQMGAFAPGAAKSTWPEFLMAHLAEATKGLGQMGQTGLDYGRSAANTLGIGDSLLASQKAVYNDIMGNAQNPKTLSSLITGQPNPNANDYLSNLAAEKAKTATAQERLGTVGTIASNLTGGGPLGEVAASVRAAPYLSKLPGWLASRIAGATTGGVSTTMGEVGRNESLSPWDIGVGTLFGSVGGAPAGGGSKLPTSPSAQSYFDQATKEYKPLSNILYDAKSEVHPTLDTADAKNALNDWSGYKWDKATGTKAEIDTLLDKPQLSANDIDQSRRALGKIQGNPNASDNDQMYAKYYRDRLQSVLDNGTPQTGVPQNWTPPPLPNVKAPPTGEGTITINGQPFKYADGEFIQPSYASSVIAKGKFLTGQARDMERTDVWHDVGGTTAGRDIGTQSGSWSADQAARAAAGKPGVFAPPGSPYFNATEALAQTTGRPTPLDWYAKHFVLGPLAFTAAAEGINATTGGEATGHQPWYARLAEELTAGAVLSGGAKLYRGYTGAANTAEQQAAEAALRQTIASRTMQNPAGTYSRISTVAPPSPMLDAIRRMIYGQSAAGSLPGQQ